MMVVVKLDEKEVSAFDNFLSEVTKENADDIDFFYDFGMRYQYALEELRKGRRSYLLFMDKEQIVSFAFCSEAFDGEIHIISLMDETEEFVSLVKENYPDSLINSGYYFDSKKYGYYKCKYNSTINPEKEYYLMSSSSCYYVSREEDVYKLRDIFEKRYFPELKNYSSISFELLSCEDILKYFDSFERDIFFVPVWKKSSIYPVVAGFHYFSSNYDTNPKRKYLVAKINNIIIGIICFASYSLICMENDIILSYIDISEKYQGKGIATMLFQELNKYLDADKTLYTTKQSAKGKECHIFDVCQREVKIKVEELPY